MADGGSPAPGGSFTVLKLKRKNDMVLVHQINSEAMPTPEEDVGIYPFGTFAATRRIATDTMGNA